MPFRQGSARSVCRDFVPTCAAMLVCSYVLAMATVDDSSFIILTSLLATVCVFPFPLHAALCATSFTLQLVLAGECVCIPSVLPPYSCGLRAAVCLWDACW